jgi:hypothetical protein
MKQRGVSHTMMALPFYIKKGISRQKKKSYGNSNQPHRPKPDPETCCCTNGGGACRLFVVQGLQLTSVLLSPQHEFHLIIPKICFSITTSIRQLLCTSNCPQHHNTPSNPCNKAFWCIERW